MTGTTFTAAGAVRAGRRRGATAGRAGATLPTLALCLVGLFGFVALAVDVGMMAVSRAQAQNIADTAAMTGARSLDGSATNNTTVATANARAAAKENGILGQKVTDSEISVRHGCYHYYDSGPYAETFQPVFAPLPAGDNYNLCEATVTLRRGTMFARALAIDSFNVTATATAAHRPRDMTIILDFSGSMNNESDLWNNESYLGAANNSPNNTDPVFPQFGHYSDVSNAKMRCTSGDPRVGKCNITVSVAGMPAMVNDFYQHSRGAGAAVPAFSPAPDSYATLPGGDNFLKGNRNNAESNYAYHVYDIFNTNSRQLDWELDGYSGLTTNLANQTNYAAAPFAGYTQGPKYYGKTFFIWPPDPRVPLTGTRGREQVKLFLKEIIDPSNANSQVPNSAPYDQIWQRWPGTGAANPWSSETELRIYLTTTPGLLYLPNSDQRLEKILRLFNRPNCDWRQRFFLKPGGTYPNFGGPVDDDRCLWDGDGTANNGGNWRNPVGTSANPATGVNTNYVINYRAILAWIKSSPNPFPAQLRAGRILYYDAIPDDVPAAAYDYSNANSAIAWNNQNERFWKEYIDYVLGVWRDPSSTGATNNVRNPGTPACSYGPDWNWGTRQIRANPMSPTWTYTFPGPASIHYSDNPKRPRHHFWFGPMTLIQFLSDTGHLPGNVHDVSMFSAKMGIASAIEDIKNNHPNDLVSLILFNRPRFTGEAAERGRFSNAQFALSRDYTAMKAALWFPPNTSSADVRPWDPDGIQTPSSGADYQSNTCSNYGFMLAYNQFTAAPSARSDGLGGSGRKGAQRLIIFETDGMANVAAIATFQVDSNGKDYYYRLGSNDTVTSGGSAQSAAITAATRLCALETDSVNGPGFAKPGRPVIIHCIAFGAVFENFTRGDGSEGDTGTTFLQQLATIGGTAFPDSPSDPTNGFKFATGTLDERKSKLRQAFQKISDSGLSPALIR